jgi:hypothetical protein
LRIIDRSFRDQGFVCDFAAAPVAQGLRARFAHPIGQPA